MSEAMRESRKPEENKHLNWMSRIRQWFRGRIEEPESEAKKEVKNAESIETKSGIKEVIPELVRKPRPEEGASRPPKMSPAKVAIKEKVSKQAIRVVGGKENPTPIGKIQPKRIAVESLDHLSDEEMLKKMTGESKVDAEEAKRIMDTRRAEKESKDEGPKTKTETLKTYPQNPQEELDLHGKKAEEAARAIRQFLLWARRQGLRTVRVITGKGLHSEGGESVLRKVAEDKIRELMNEKVVFGFSWERGRGSLLVHLVS